MVPCPPKLNCTLSWTVIHLKVYLLSFLKENTFNFHIYIYARNCDLGKYDKSKDCIVDSENKIYLESLSKISAGGYFCLTILVSALAWRPHVSLALLKSLFDLSQGNSILLTLSSNSLSLIFLLPETGDCLSCLPLIFLPFSVKFILTVLASKPSSHSTCSSPVL